MWPTAPGCAFYDLYSNLADAIAGKASLWSPGASALQSEAVVDAVDVPVTLKTRTGWNKDNRNAINIARIAENSGIRALAIHGRTRACGYTGHAEYEYDPTDPFPTGFEL